MKEILILGYFGYHTNQLDGQTVKTRDLYHLVDNKMGYSVDYFDTEDFKYNKLSVFKMLWKVISCKNLFYLPAHNNLKYIFPIIFCLSILFRFRINYFVVGGWLSDYIKVLPIHRIMLSRVKGIHVETHKLCYDLKHCNGLDNVDIFPNFRFFDYDENRSLDSEKFKKSPVLKLVFVSRVDQTKGLDTLLQVAEILRNQYPTSFVTIDFYGQKKDEYFDKYLSDVPFYSYKGELKPEQVIPTLGNYDALIFPTHYDGEGCPGILIEALAAGIPIIASDWKYNSEFISTGENGFLCDTYNAEGYVKVMETLFYDTELRKTMSMKSYIMGRPFSESSAKKLIYNILN